MVISPEAAERRAVPSDFSSPGARIDSADKTEAVELSIVMPCLNEADTLGVCLEKAFGALRGSGISGEVIVADNGSTDGSVQIAQSMGARVIAVSARGYGSALMG